MVRAVRESIVMCPPFVIAHEEIERIGRIVTEALNEAQRELTEARGGET